MSIGRKLIIGAKLLAKPWFRITDPYGSILDEAIRRAEEKAKAVKVAILTPGLRIGGGERWVASLCNHLDIRKVAVLAVVLNDPKNLDEQVRGWFPAHTKLVIGKQYLPSVMSQVDLLISWGPVDLDTATAGATIPIIDVAHGTLGHWDGMQQNGFAIQESIARQAIKAGAHLAAVNEECLANYPEDYRDKVTVIPNGAELSRVESSLTREQAKAKFGIPECQKVVLFAGRFSKEKNLQALVDAMDFLPGWTLLAAGPKHQMPERIEGKLIVMPGAVDPPGDLYRAADVACMPSKHEAHSIGLIEYNLAGVPVVSYDYPAMKHLTAKHGPLAWLVPVGCSPQGLAAEIICAYERLDSPGFQDCDRVERIQKIAMEHYTAEAMAKRWEKYILSVSQTAKQPT